MISKSSPRSGAGITKIRSTARVRILKDSFWNSIEYVTYRQEEDEEFWQFFVLFSWQALHLRTQMRIVKCFAFAKREIMCDAHCEISRLARCEMKFAHVRVANISHLQSKYFTAKRFHLPERANFVGAVSLTELRQWTVFFWWYTGLWPDDIHAEGVVIYKATPR